MVKCYCEMLLRNVRTRNKKTNISFVCKKTGINK